MKEPIVFEPIYQTRVWGGRKLETALGRELPDPEQPFGESWEISGRPEAESRVARGMFTGRTINQLWRDPELRPIIFGSEAPFEGGEDFPLLCKILDARERLSLQVHPPESVAESLRGEPKSEMWFVAEAEPGAELFVGLKAGTTRDQFVDAMINTAVEDLVHRLPVKAGDSIYIPSGRLHAIGAGILIYEIQQNSDTTYRVFDWNRTGLDGKPRQLHIEESLQSIDFSDIEPGLDSDSGDGRVLAECEHFLVERHTVIGGGMDLYLPQESFAIVTVATGTVRFRDEEFRAGDFFIVPAEMAALKALEADSESEVLLTTWPE